MFRAPERVTFAERPSFANDRMGRDMMPSASEEGYGRNQQMSFGNMGSNSGFQEAEQSDFLLVERVRNYIMLMYQRMCENNVQEVRHLYYVEWTNLTNMYYKDVEWPSVREISGLCQNNEVFLLCYKELYYRHIFVNGRPLIHHRMESWENYRGLFDMFLDGADTAQLQLPLEWLGDMVDEFLYQFQDFCTYRHKLQDLSEEELEILENNPNIWKVQLVLGYLHSFVDRSGITRILSGESSVTGHQLKLFTVREALGYFSLIGLCRVHCLLGDYRLAIQVLNPIDIEDKRALFTRMSSTHITLFYYLGFAYMMMNRYADAVNVFSTILLAHRGSKGRTTCFSDGMIMKKYDKVRALCALAYSLSPGIRIDEQVRQLIMEKYGDSMQLLMQRREKTYEEVFKYSCPKFVTPSTPNYSDLQNRHHEAYQLQLKWFLRSVRQQDTLPEIRSFLKLYTSISMSKLSNICAVEEGIFREKLISIKYKSYQPTHGQDSSPPLEGKRTCANDVHFFIVGDMIHIEETKRAQRFGQFFMTHALKFQQAIDDLHAGEQRKGPIKGKKTAKKK